MKKSLIFLNLLFFLSCSENLLDTANNLPPTDFTVTVVAINYTSATISWTPAIDPEGGVVAYSVYIKDQLISDSISDTSYHFYDLEHNSSYSGKIIAFDPQGRQNSSSFSFNTLIANVLDRGITLNSQDKIDEFSQNNYNIIKGDLLLGNLTGPYGIPYSDISDLSSLESISAVEGSIIIHYNRLLTNLNGLQNIISAGGLRLLNLESLRSIEKLQNLAQLKGNLLIREIDLLESFNGLEQLTDIDGNLEIIYNNALKDIDGLNNLGEVGGNIVIRNIWYLEDIKFTNLTYVGGNFEISENSTLDEITGMENLLKIGGELKITKTDRITGFNNLTSIGGLTLINNYVLNNIESLQNLTVLNNLYLENNQLLASLDFLSNINSISGNVIIIQNGRLENLAGLNNLKLVGVNLELIKNYYLSDISALTSLTTVGGSLKIHDADGLLNLDDLKSINSVTSFSFYHNSQLTNFCGIKDYLTNHPNTEIYIQDNAYNPSKEDIISGNCSN